MRLSETNNTDQYEVTSDIDENTIMDVVVNKKRFAAIKEVHMNKYNSAEFFWEMFERDLFETDK